MMPEASQCSPNSIDENWDAVIIGAGPAGGLAALRAAQSGMKVLLVEAKEFPRDKVCGGCLNARAWNVLQAHGLTKPLLAEAPPRVESLHLVCGRQSVRWRLPTMMAVSRTLLDETIVAAAIKQGATFIDSTHAKVLPLSPTHTDHIEVQLRMRGSESMTVKAKAAASADGLSRSSLSLLKLGQSVVDRNSRIGVGVTVNTPSSAYPDGELSMVVGDCGYVGLARVEGNALRVAAAVDPHPLKSEKSVAAVIARVLHENNCPVPEELAEADWHGTLPLTRSSTKLSAHRLFLLGDTTGYVEPFTGEGMSWALTGAVELSPILEQAVHRWDSSLSANWQSVWAARVRRHRRLCRSLAWILRRPRLATRVLWLADRSPWIVRQVMERISDERISSLALES